MGTSQDYSRPVRMTESGQALNRATRVSTLTVNAVDQDTIVNLRDGNAAGPILWTAEADNASSSYTQNFNPPLIFANKLYIEFVVKGDQSSACLALVEPL
jgi:hypothetical protein